MLNRFLLIFIFIINSAYAVEELPIVVVVCSYNNAPWVVKNLDSVLMQAYTNYSLMYVDDASQDGTAGLVEQYFHEHDLEDEWVLIRNEKRCRKMKNIYNVYHQVGDECIIVQLDGDDWFAHENVLSDINEAYLNPNVWLTYGKHINDPKGFKGAESRPFPAKYSRKRLYRKSITPMPTRTFYAWLFKQVKLQDFLSTSVEGWQGKFYPACNDCAIMYPMMEMAHRKARYLKKISYVANRKNPLIGLKKDRAIQKSSGRELKRKKIYPLLKKPIIHSAEMFEDAKADMIIFANQTDKIEDTIMSIKNMIKNIDTLHILNTSTNAFIFDDEDGECIDIFTTNTKVLIEYIEQLPQDYILLCDDTSIIDQEFDCKDCIKQLEKTFAYGFYCALSPQVFDAQRVPYEHVHNDLYAWKFSCDIKNTMPVHSFNAVLYRKKDFINALKKIQGNSIDAIIDAFLKIVFNKDSVGLFFGDTA